MEDIFEEIEQERYLQDKKWGEQNHPPDYWMVILMEELGEACKEICGKSINLQAYREEMVQVAAVAVAALECLDRGRRTHG